MDNTEIIGILASFAIAAVVGAITIKRPKEDMASWAITLTSLLIGLLITSHLNMRNELNHLTSQQFLSNLKASEGAKRLARSSSNAKAKIDPIKSTFFMELLQRNIDRASTNFISLQKLEINYLISNFRELGELQSDVIEIFRNVENHTRIRATSYVDIEQWWTGIFGEKYTEENNNALARGVEIERIFIFSDETEVTRPDNNKLMASQKESGVKVYYVLFSDIEKYVEDKIDIILVGDEFYGVLNLIERKMKRATFSADKKKINELFYYWNNIKSVAKEF